MDPSTRRRSINEFETTITGETALTLDRIEERDMEARDKILIVVGGRVKHDG